MATIKAYTDLSQSKVLAKILPPESADMADIASSTDDEGKTMIEKGLALEALKDMYKLKNK